jgi:hypothetical protein
VSGGSTDGWRTRTFALGVAGERRVAALLQAEGYQVSRFVGSRGPFDLVAIGLGIVRLIQVKVGHRNYLERQTREQVAGLALPPGTVTECWRLETLDAPPIIEAPIRPPRVPTAPFGRREKPCQALGCRQHFIVRYASHWACRKYCCWTCANRATAAVRTAARLRTAAIRRTHGMV